MVSRLTRPALLLALAIAPTAPVLHAAGRAGEDLSKVYPATKGWSQNGLFTVCTAEDVWELKSFEYRFGQDLLIRCKRATVAFGRDGTNVLWAAVFPERPAAIESTMAGDGEQAETLFLRFAPAEIERVFPAATVAGRGPAWRRAEAQRIARHKIGWRWSTPSGNPTIVQPGWCLVDVDTVEGPRRFYGVDRNGGTVEYVAEFEQRRVPASPPIESKAALAAFDEVCEAFDREYAGFVLLPQLDWKKLGKNHRRLAGEVRTVFELGAVLGDLLARLEDLHVWVEAGDDMLPGYERARPLNGSWKATQALASATRKAGGDLVWGRAEDGIGYLGVHGLSDSGLPEHVDEALEQLADTWGLIVDLRFNGGGDELLGRALAGRFLDEERVYSLNQYRSGAQHDALGPRVERAVGPRGPWRYESPVVVLIGQRTMSSAESTALMFAQCPQVTTLGDRTAGSSGNPRRIELDCGIAVNLPRWLDMDPDGNPLERVGVQPDEWVEADPGAFSDTADPVMEAALEHLRKLPAGKREPGRR